MEEQIRQREFGINENAMLVCEVIESNGQSHVRVTMASYGTDGQRLHLTDAAFDVFMNEVLKRYANQPHTWLALRGGKLLIKKTAIIAWKNITGGDNHYVRLTFAGFGSAGVNILLQDSEADEFLDAVEAQAKTIEPDPLKDFLLI